MLSYAYQITGRSPRTTSAAAGNLIRISSALLPTSAGNQEVIHPRPSYSLSPSSSPNNTQQQQQQQQQIRWKHSERQIKRLFRKHPAIVRVEKREGIDRTPEPMPPPQFKAVFDPQFLSNGWSSPPGPDDDVTTKIIPNYPFSISRTKNKPNDAAGFLPVYTKYRYVPTNQ